MADKEEFISLEKALAELRLKEDDLKRLVSEGEIRAFRDADKMKFKREDIEKLKQDTGKTIRFQDESSDTLTDDLLFDEEVEDLDIDDGEIGMATAPISSDATFIEDKPKKSAGKGKGKTGGKSAPAAKTRVTRTVPAEPAAAKKDSGAGGGRTTQIRRTTGRSTQMLAKAEVAKTEVGMLWAGVMMVTTIVLVLGVFVWNDIADGSASDFSKAIGEKGNGMFGQK
ncbi:MAG: hypothetical protein R3F20_05865 [Planctomycetota bacterium]